MARAYKVPPSYWIDGLSDIERWLLDHAVLEVGGRDEQRQTELERLKMEQRLRGLQGAYP